MGLERLVAVLDGVRSNYDTDLFQPIIQSLAQQAGLRYGEDAGRDVSLRVIADHLRAITMLVTEGVIPGPEKRGAVLRRILRRALRHGRLLELPVPFLHTHLGEVVEILGPTFPELGENLSIVERVVRREEERFDRTLADGFERLEQSIDALEGAGDKSFPGDEAFVLESERGLPMDLIRDALEERGLALDESSYEKAREKHVAASRVVKEAAGEQLGLEELEPFRGNGSHFVGYDATRVPAARVVGILGDDGTLERLEAGASGRVILDETPFYAESGGQAGDRGLLVGADLRARVEDTKSPLGGVILHELRVEQGQLAVGDVVAAEVDQPSRDGSRRHHTATHLLHAALRRVLGSHVKQAGSLVAPDRLRFDFAHFDALSADEIAEIEEAVNASVLENVAVATEELPLEEALDRGAIAFFGDRYGERVRVVGVGETSMELCGGTHVERTGAIGPFRILSERGVAAGVRRIEALAGHPALAREREDRDLLARLEERLGAHRDDVVEQLERRLEQLKALQKENEALSLKLARGESGGGGETVDVDGISVVARRAEGLNKSQRRDLADGLRQKHSSGVVVLGAADGEKAALLVAVGDEARARIDARDVIRRLAPIVGGGGGGRPDLAEAGGKNPAALDDALAAAAQAVRETLES